MNTIKITVTLTPFESWFAEILMAEMADLGFESFVETDNSFEAFIPEKNHSKEVSDHLLGYRKEGFELHWSEEIIPAQNWNEVWEKNYFRPLVIKDRVVVRAPFHAEYPACPIEIVIEPNMAFGTGNHETTILMMETMLEMDWKGKTVLDMGCGTGILAILASKLGAPDVMAIDIDRWSFDAVSENRLINNTIHIKPALGGAEVIGDHKFDVLLVNIQKNVILSDMATYSNALLPGGKILFSGFFEADLPQIQQSAESLRLKLISKKVKNNWIVAVFQKSEI
jgi:ribosomal protein L11 methyltransferase